MYIYYFKTILILVLYNICYVWSDAIKLTTTNIDSILSSHQVVFINFYANWCRFSQMLNPIYDQLADKLSKEYTVCLLAIGKVDCDSESSISTKYNINKYPTLKLFRHSILIKREYRGARQLDALIDYIHKQIESPIIKLFNKTDLIKLDMNKDYIIGHFNDYLSDNYKIYSKVANLLRDQCLFAASNNILEEFENERPTNDIIYYRPSKSSNKSDEYYKGELNNEEIFYRWSHNKCLHLVREITFENAEELTDEGLPFLILFHHIDDHKSVSIFEYQVQKQLMHQTASINCLHADGAKFLHPLEHIGKGMSDLPLLVIDTFRHMFIFPDFNQISINGKLLEFVKDLHSGKLHEHFHNPIPSTKQTIIQKNIDSKIKDNGIDIGKSLSNKKDDLSQRSENEFVKINNRLYPPESVFVRLTPSRQRYSFRDEL
ncbi:unnamed protein product [Rotaria sp. Silwood1]|nr:unnamed protein product [Rotaria sp. Silwood1]CAF1631120.1 unnamed protein product [Rotaria sp. Silwood1]